ncbi:hypothetical protein A2625_01840 [candidate division WOR-1 bacterium RIFCSPHIGHO2_01_FULL_53_15]|uniref:Uncharacterized protein n=1 Tax=candidate division WOR-1 bacterium RIFCSPHIGHO2_01_FULL_53_15 TaxID=1802564 RepID=A0A1F4Q2G8_UNCSA|nr:MAG: hypothetical protein A2625_01840 [candidate division WOR-1 bacterium RIFCSPHIGHO2_01_FULL_53_15]OGC13608.1 MAG: hypothetical protein A3D23_06165 [candidate division WOR-1 bacterium RIFCSPHIGHO2_02_FULL_53_26]
MKLDDKIRNRRLAYLLKGERSTAFELALLYYILATRRTAEDKIADACLKSIQWLRSAGIRVADNITLGSIEQILVNNKAMIRDRADSSATADKLVHATPVYSRGLGLAY